MALPASARSAAPEISASESAETSSESSEIPSAESVMVIVSASSGIVQDASDDETLYEVALVVDEFLPASGVIAASFVP